MKNDKVINRLGCQYCLALLAQHFSCCVSPSLSWCRLLLRKLSFFAGSFCDVADRASSTDPVPSKPFFATEQRQSSGDRASQRRSSAQTVMMLPSGSLWVFLFLEISKWISAGIINKSDESKAHVANCTVTEITSMLARDSEIRHPFSAEPTREILPSLRESLLSHNDVYCCQQLHSCSHCRTNCLCPDGFHSDEISADK